MPLLYCKTKGEIEDYRRKPIRTEASSGLKPKWNFFIKQSLQGKEDQREIPEAFRLEIIDQGTLLSAGKYLRKGNNLKA